MPSRPADRHAPCQRHPASWRCPAAQPQPRLSQTLKTVRDRLLHYPAGLLVAVQQGCGPLCCRGGEKVPPRPPCRRSLAADWSHTSINTGRARQGLAAGISSPSQSFPVPAPSLPGLPCSAAAWRFAPTIYAHPLERYHLQSPATWFEAAQVYYQDYKNASESIYTWRTDNWLDTLMFMPKCASGSSSTYVSGAVGARHSTHRGCAQCELHAHATTPHQHLPCPAGTLPAWSTRAR